MSLKTICRKVCLEHQIKKYENYLLEEGLRVANSREMDFIHLPKNEAGQTDISKILSLGAEDNADIGRRYLVYKRILERLQRH
ncbi:hypothetical protein J4416_04415 [Candidatus Pacearchaeota archaeon]|nr:hypothetical protein [Candidatus Pacearchaeota archaeon]